MKRKTLQITLLFVLIIWIISSCNLGNEITETPNTPEVEALELQAYMDSLVVQGYDIDTTDLGIYYITIEEGEGDFPQQGDTLEVGYSGYLIGGYLFDSSDLYNEDGTFEFQLENPPMIEGWDDGMKVINKGAKVQLMIPSEFAYGETGNGIIGPYESLIFVVEMFDIRPSN